MIVGINGTWQENVKHNTCDLNSSLMALTIRMVQSAQGSCALECTSQISNYSLVLSHFFLMQINNECK